jgi:Tfp pilus assembly protein PilP
MKRKIIFPIVLGAGVVMSIFFYGCFALKGEEADIEIESFLPPIFLYNSEGLRDPFIPLVAKEKLVVVEEEKKTRQEVEKPEKTNQKVERPKLKKIVTHSGYRLIGLIWDKKGVFALIEGEDGKWIVKKGDRIGKFQVFKVEPKKGEVTLIGEEKIVKLRMRE